MSAAGSRDRSASADPLDLELYRRAIGLLARRDHGREELARKLLARHGGRSAVEAVLDRLQEDGLLDDRRYARHYVEQRAARRQGPLLIRARLRERGIASVSIDAALASYAGEWETIAEAAVADRFDGATLASGDARDAARVARFLASRGFDRGQAMRAFHRARSNAASAEPD